MAIPILIIEDDPDHQFLTVTHLSRAGFDDVEVVQTLEEAFAACAERSREVLLIDSSVVRDDRRGTMDRFKDLCPGARVIAYSAISPDHRWADAHFVKGEDTESLLAEVAKGPLGSEG